MSLDKKDFRIGNIIRGSQYFNTDEAKDDLGEDYSLENEWVFLKIESIEHENSNFNFFLYRIQAKSIPDPEMWARLEPIRLTKEIFDAIGWKHHAVDNFFESPDGKITYSFSGEMSFNPHEHTNHLEFIVLNTKIQDLHELQNAYYFFMQKDFDVSGLEKPLLLHRKSSKPKDLYFWKRLKYFISDIEPNCPADQEEKEMILKTCDANIKEWGDSYDVTAVEYNPEIAKI